MERVFIYLTLIPTAVPTSYCQTVIALESYPRLGEELLLPSESPFQENLKFVNLLVTLEKTTEMWPLLCKTEANYCLLVYLKELKFFSVDTTAFQF